MWFLWCVQIATLRVSPGILRANPFMLPTNLADRAISMAQQGVGGSGSGSGSGSGGTSSRDPVVADAEQLLVSTSTSASLRALAIRRNLRRGGATTPVVAWQSTGAGDSGALECGD